MGKEYLEGKITVEIPNGTGFPEGADPYAKVYMIKDGMLGSKWSCMKISDKERNSTDPEFEMSFEKNLKNDYEGFAVRVKDSEVFRDDKFGEIVIDAEQLKSGEEISGEFPLTGGHEQGVINMTIKFEEDSVMFEYNTESDSD